MWSKVRNGFVAGLTGLTLITGCVKEDSNSSQYTEMVNKYNALLSTSYQSQLKAESEQKELQELDSALKTFSDDADEVRRLAAKMTVANPDPGVTAALKELDSALYSVNTRIVSLESDVLAEYTALINNSVNVYEKASLNQNRLTKDKSRIASKARVLEGLHSLVNGDRAGLYAEVQFRMAAIKVTLGNATPRIPTPEVPQIKFTERDNEVRTQVQRGSSGFARSADNSLQSFSDVESVAAFAQQNSFDVSAARQGAELAGKTGGMVSFAGERKQLPSAISDSVSQFKPQMNFNTDDLELAFLIDYSGSMSDDIEAVINGLVDIVKEMENLKVAGRRVKIGIVTFGLIGREKVNLDLTSDLTKVRDTLTTLLQRYGAETHSDGPGEGSYHGIRLAAEKLSWSSRNRMSIVITDETAKEVDIGDNDYVNGTLSALATRNIQNHIYTILVH